MSYRKYESKEMLVNYDNDGNMHNVSRNYPAVVFDKGDRKYGVFFHHGKIGRKEGDDRATLIVMDSRDNIIVQAHIRNGTKGQYKYTIRKNGKANHIEFSDGGQIRIQSWRNKNGAYMNRGGKPNIIISRRQPNGRFSIIRKEERDVHGQIINEKNYTVEELESRRTLMSRIQFQLANPTKRRGGVTKDEIINVLRDFGDSNVRGTKTVLLNRLRQYFA